MCAGALDFGLRHILWVVTTRVAHIVVHPQFKSGLISPSFSKKIARFTELASLTGHGARLLFGTRRTTFRKSR